MYSERKSVMDGSYSPTCAVEAPRTTYRDTAINAISEINDRLRQINNALGEIAGSTPCGDVSKRQEPCCFMEDLTLRQGDAFCLLGEIEEKIRRII